MNPTQRPDSFELADYTGVLRRRWWIILGGACLGVLAGLAYLQVSPKSYTATAAVYVTATGADQTSQLANSRTGGSVNLDTEAQIVTSSTVGTIAAKQLHSPLTPWALSKQVSVTVPPNSSILDIACDASSAKGAADCAEAFATAYLQNRAASSTATLNSQVSNLQSKLDSLQKSVTALNAKASSLPSNSPTKLGDQAQAASQQSQIHSLDSRIATLNSLIADNNGGYVITKASPPGAPSKPKKSIVLPGALVAGLVIGLILAFIWDRRDKQLRGPQDIERFLDLPVMLNVPPNTFSRQVSLVMPRSVAGRSFAELGHTVAATLGDGNHVLLVTGASPGPGGSVVAANLAATMARTHPEVVLLCADLNACVAPELLGIEEGPGLAEVVVGEASVREVVRSPAAVPGLWVITPGAEALLSAYYIEHDRARALITQLRKDARYVIIEAQSAGDLADTFAFAEFADAALLVVETRRTERDEAVKCARLVQRMRAPVIGVALLPAMGRRVKVRPPRQSQQPEQRKANGGRRPGNAGRPEIAGHVPAFVSGPGQATDSHRAAQSGLRG